jgi:hypothetical protein
VPRTVLILAGLLILLLCAGALLLARPPFVTSLLVQLGLIEPPKLTLAERLDLIAPAATERLRPYFEAAEVPYPPAEVTLVGLKAEKLLQLYARGGGQPWRLVHTYPVLAASGGPGPKLKEGDRQVPEGLYGIDFLNPNSQYNVSMRVTYPNDFDRAMAAKELRDNLGGAIMIHGRAASIGCLAIGDPASEELFTLAAAVGLPNIRVILAPVDLRRQKQPDVAGAPSWLPEVYRQIDAELRQLPLPSG